jgi:hypothetical protein
VRELRKDARFVIEKIWDYVRKFLVFEQLIIG